jgi:predicted RNase H-like nuclease
MRRADRFEAPCDLAAGADGCRSGWICLLRDRRGAIASRLFETAQPLIDQEPRPSVLAIDVPIGLLEAGARLCDVEARKRLGPRASSVFPAPIRPILAAATWEEACSIRERIERRRISKQAWGIVRKVDEVDRALRRPPARPGWVREVHPEVCFWAWRGGDPMREAKKRAAGREARRDLVEGYFGAEAFPEVRRRHRRADVADDDILDAFAALWTAERIVLEGAATLPEHPPIDRHGLPMEIVY